MSDGAFEARVSAKRETSAGIFLTLEIQPDDYSQALAMLRVGSALQVGWAEIVDVSVHKIDVDTPQAAGGRARADALSPERRSEIAAKGAEARWKDRRKFSELSAAQQSGMLCDDVNFRKFLFLNDYNRGMLDGSVEEAAKEVRRACGVKSRADIPNDINALDRWKTLLARYRQYETDQLASQLESR